MPDKKPSSQSRTNEATQGKSPPGGDTASGASPPLVDAELVQLRIRVIALENIVVALLAHAPERQREFARQMASHISPRQGYTAHPTTLHAAAEIESLVRRADAFRADGQGGAE